MGKYEIPKETNLKQYYIEEENYPGVFGTGKVIAQMEGTTGINDRFYVMALEDITIETIFCWYNAASGKLDKTVNSSTYDFGAGKKNTAYVMDKWKNSLWGEQDAGGTYFLDMWGVIEDEVDAGWFVPSKSEWAAFGDKFKITSSNYVNQFGLSDSYWSSSQNSTNTAYIANFNMGTVDTLNVDYRSWVRLSTTF